MAPESPVWCITGASSGFGREIALSVFQRGHRVIATARDISKISDLEEKGACVLALDVADPSANSPRLPRPRSGVSPHRLSDQCRWRHFAVNVFGTTNVIRAFLPHQRAQPEELAPFDIQATVIEPGYFRTGIPAYKDEATPSGRVRKELEAHDGHQLGDVKKGASMCVDILTSSGVAEGRELPLRVVLGSDCVDAIRNKCQGTLDLLDSWGEISVQSGHV
ncbi:hypothetical protein BDW75DRAFT_250560 [Aspergillus navahoensis]